MAPPSLKMYATLRGFTRQNFISNSSKYTDVSKKEIKYESRIIDEGIHVVLFNGISMTMYEGIIHISVSDVY